MQKKVMIALVMGILMLFAATGCTFSHGQFDTQTSLSPMEYTIAVNKEIGLVLNLLEEHMTNGKNVLKSHYPVTDEIDNVEHTLIMVGEAIDSVDRLYPPNTYDDDRLDILRRMENAKDTLELYREALEDPELDGVSALIDLMRGDFVALKGSFNIQWE